MQFLNLNFNLTSKRLSSLCLVHWIGVWQTPCAATADTIVNVLSVQPACCHCQRRHVLDSAVVLPMPRHCQRLAHVTFCHLCCYSINAPYKNKWQIY